MTATTIKTPVTPKAFWAAAFFYLIIGFEFFYMASPFAVYFYSIYGPGLRFINHSPALTWLTNLFLPHIAEETTSGLLRERNVIGAVLAFIGFLGFCLGAVQVYYHKLARKGAVLGGVYSLIRHPQYASLMLCGFGLLILWPRYIVLLSFTSMIFVYYFLARYEEEECEKKFGEPYLYYKSRTAMFLPLPVSFRVKRGFLPKSKIPRLLTILLIYGLLSFLAVIAANGLKSWSVNSLYGLFYDNQAFISVAKIETATTEELVRIVFNNPDVKKRIEIETQSRQQKFINYILPAQWYVSEIPMNRVEGAVGGHYHPKGYNQNLQRIVFTRAELRPGTVAKGRDILLHTVRNEPLLEVVVDLGRNRVVGYQDPPARRKYDGIPVPLF
ncbi:MAG: isoprenylcysteine carboxylmethyltransferase family protein [Thermodesulfobacteriota bacterium]